MVGIWEPVLETQKVYLYKYFCILLAFRILSPETISVMWNFHSSWQKLPSGFCSWHSTKLPGEVTEDSSSCQILWLPLCGRWHSDHLLKSLILWFSLSSICGVRPLCLLGSWRWVRYSFHSLRNYTQQRNQMHDQWVQWDASISVSEACVTLSRCTWGGRGGEHGKDMLNLLGRDVWSLKLPPAFQ